MLWYVYRLYYDDNRSKWLAVENQQEKLNADSNKYVSRTQCKPIVINIVYQTYTTMQHTLLNKKRGIKTQECIYNFHTFQKIKKITTTSSQIHLYTICNRNINQSNDVPIEKYNNYDKHFLKLEFHRKNLLQSATTEIKTRWNMLIYFK